MPRISATQFLALSHVQFSIVDQLREANAVHPELLALQQRLATDPTSLPGFLFKDKLLFFNSRLVLPSDSPLRTSLLTEFHLSPVGGHSGITRTFHRLTTNVY